MKPTQLVFNPKDLCWACITKTNVKQNAGLHLVENNDGTICVDLVDGAFGSFTEVKPGDRLLKIQGKDVGTFEGGVEEINRLIKESLRIEIEVLQPRKAKDDCDPTSVVTLIAAGDMMTLQDLTVTPELNGKLVKVKRESTKEGRWLVEVQGSGEKMIVDCKNLLMPEPDEEVTGTYENGQYTMGGEVNETLRKWSTSN
jgi:hypothetical protein